MHIIYGGNYKGREYGCMFTPWDVFTSFADMLEMQIDDILEEFGMETR